MTATTIDSVPVRAPARWLLPLMVFQATYAVGAVTLVATLLLGGMASLIGSLRLVALGLAVGLAVTTSLAAVRIAQRRHVGRLLGFLADYLLAVVAGFLTLQAVNFFNGLDALGATFSRGLPLLVMVGAGALLFGLARRMPSIGSGLRIAGRVTMAVGAGAMLIRVGLLPGVATFLGRIIQPPAVLWLLLGLMAGGFALLLWRGSADEVFGSSRDQIEVMQGFFFVSPNVLGFLLFFAGPLLFSLFVTFTDWDGINQANWIGFGNYAEILGLQFRSLTDGASASSVLDRGYVEMFQIGRMVVGARDILFWTSLRNVVVFSVVAVPLSILPALVIAALLNTKLPFVKFFRAIYFLPSIAGVVGVALIWKQLFSATIGFVNYAILRFFDLLNLIPGVELGAPQPEWLASSRTALVAVIVIFCWSVIGFNTVLFLAGMQGIPGSLYEAADLDGAGPIAKFRKITVPLLAPTTVFVVATTTILALQLFNEPFILNVPNPPNGPSNSTLTPVIHLYRNAFEDFDQGYASAVAWILFVLIFAITLFYFRRQGDDGVLA